MVRHVTLVCFLSSVLAAFCPAAELAFVSVPQGYHAGSIHLPRGFTGALGVDPTDDQIVYASVGGFGDVDLSRIDLHSGTATIVAEGPFGNIGGIAVLSATEIVLVENAGAAGGPPDKTILLASDLNADGDFNDAQELRELIAPILEGFFGWSGAQARLVPPGSPASIPSGSVLIQTADGSGAAEVLVVTDPLGSPTYRPAGGAFFAGFDFNGGLDFDSQGRLLVGAATVIDPTTFVIAGQVFGTQNLNSDQVIGASESHILVPSGQLPSGISDLVVDREDDAFCTSGGSIKTFHVPANVLSGEVAVTDFAPTHSSFLSAVLLNSRARSFEPFSGPGGAILLVGGGFGETNLLTLTPTAKADLNGDGLIDTTDLLLFQEQWWGLSDVR
jgi:hypothetical protein